MVENSGVLSTLGSELKGVSSDVLEVGFVGVQRTSISPSTPVQPLKVTIGSGDTLSMLYGVGGGLKGISCDILTAGLVGAQRMSISPSTPVQPLKATVG